MMSLGDQKVSLCWTLTLVGVVRNAEVHVTRVHHRSVLGQQRRVEIKRAPSVWARGVKGQTSEEKKVNRMGEKEQHTCCVGDAGAALRVPGYRRTKRELRHGPQHMRHLKPTIAVEGLWLHVHGLAHCGRVQKRGGGTA
jgi:hypothetical protein